jgi:DNA-directed RNA polymerase subunit alpha
MSEPILMAPRTFSLEATGPNRTLITLEPFERGFGHTVGNALRRTLLSSLSGCAVVEANIEGIMHEYATLEGIQEDVLDILLNLRGAAFILYGRDEVTLELHKSSIGPVYTGDVKLPHDVEVVNPKHVIAHLTQARDFKMTLKVIRGRGYQTSSQYETQGIGILRLDAMFNPVQRVHYTVESARVGQRTDLDRLVIDLETNGTIDPECAIREAAQIFQRQMALFLEPKQKGEQMPIVEEDTTPVNTLLLCSVSVLDLPQRATNCLRAENLHFVGDLVKTTEAQLLRTPNLGKKSLGEIKQALQLHNLHLGMSVRNWPPPGLKYPYLDSSDVPPIWSGE